MSDEGSWRVPPELIVTMRCLFRDNFSKQCEYEGPEVEQYCWRHDPEKPATMFTRNFDGPEFMEMCQGLSKEEAAYYVNAGVALYFADDQVNEWHNEYLISRLRSVLIRLTSRVRDWRADGNIKALKAYFSTGKTKKDSLSYIMKNSVLSDEEKQYFTGIAKGMGEDEFGKPGSILEDLD